MRLGLAPGRGPPRGARAGVVRWGRRRPGGSATATRRRCPSRSSAPRRRSSRTPSPRPDTTNLTRRRGGAQGCGPGAQGRRDARGHPGRRPRGPRADARQADRAARRRGRDRPAATCSTSARTRRPSRWRSRTTSTTPARTATAPTADPTCAPSARSCEAGRRRNRCWGEDMKLGLLAASLVLVAGGAVGCGDDGGGGSCRGATRAPPRTTSAGPSRPSRTTSRT